MPVPPRLDDLPFFGMRLGLEDCRRLLASFGGPQQRFATVLVAGTNGKGSTAALLAAMTTAAGYRTGLYTSPHLEEVRERVRVDGRSVGAEELETACGEVIARGVELTGRPPTYFETVTVAALRCFADAGVELAVLEVGLGGRLDATNATEPVLSLITEIGLDHQEQLGSTLAAIAGEKAGILRPATPALAWVGKPAARHALERHAKALGCPLENAIDQVRVLERRSLGWEGQETSLATARGTYRLRLALPGAHQARNLALAVRAAETLADLGWTGLDGEAVARGVAECRWPGRLESVSLPVTGRRVVLEAAHNADGARQLAVFLDELGEEVDLLFGALEDKRPETFLPLLARRCRRLVLTRPPGDRGLAAAELRRCLPANRPVTVAEEPEAALGLALKEPEDEAPPLLVCGSIYLTGRIRTLLRERYGVPAAAAETPVGPRRPSADPPLLRDQINGP